jgi:hypothetical protein
MPLEWYFRQKQKAFGLLVNIMEHTEGFLG